MIEIKQVKTENQELYGFVEELMHTAFPAQERRDTPQQREYSDSNPLFCNNVIVEDGKPVGMISYWDMQPPYRTGDSGLPMLLMTYGDIDMEKDFDKVKNMLYKEVYGQPV